MKTLQTIEKIMVDDQDLEGSFNWDEAKARVELLNSQDYKGFSDWRLPDKDELNEIYLKKDEIGGFSSISYWSSTEYIAGLVWIQLFSNGYQYYYSKGSDRLVRCVRSV